MFDKYYDEYKLKMIKEGKKQQLERMEEHYKLSVSVVGEIYDKSKVVSKSLNHRFLNIPFESEEIIVGYEVEYALLYNLVTVIQSLIYNKILGLKNSKGTANIISVYDRIEL